MSLLESINTAIVIINGFVSFHSAFCLIKNTNYLKLRWTF